MQIKQNIQINKTENLNVDLKPKLGLLMVMSAKPEEANLYIDDKLHGSTPIIIKDLLIGSHTLKLEKEGFKPLTKNIEIKETLSYEAAADCSSNNCDARFAVFATAVAETRAEGRVLRKALRLRKVIAAEEAVAVPHEDSLSDGRITQTQIKFIEVLSQRNDINIVKYLSAAKDFKFTGRLEDIPYKSAVTVIAHLSEMQRNNASISPKFKGFEQDWRK